MREPLGWGFGGGFCQPSCTFSIILLIYFMAKCHFEYCHFFSSSTDKIVKKFFNYETYIFWYKNHIEH